MSYFFRQYHIMSTLRSGKDKEAPLYKALVPLLSLHPAVQRLHTQTLGKNLQLNRNDDDASKKKPLAVILCWMLAKEGHLEKYRSMYLKKGFDVLTVNIAPKDLLFPVSGSQVIAGNVLDYLVDQGVAYDKVLVHAFSVGGYMMGEMFVKMRDHEDKYKEVGSRIKGVILDSAVDFEGIPKGFPRALTKNPITLRVMEWYIGTHLALMYNVATQHYLRSSKNFHNTPLRCPALFFSSEADRVGSPAQNRMVMENWALRGVDCKFHTFRDSKHVSHMYKYPEEYTNEVSEFIGRLDLVMDGKSSESSS